MIIARFFVAAAVFMSIFFGGFYYWLHQGHSQMVSEASYEKEGQSAQYEHFLMEGYDIVQEKYWQKASDDDLSKLFLASVQKFASSTMTLSTNDRAGVVQLVHVAIDALPEQDRGKMAETILAAVLYNLSPLGRNQLLTTTARNELQNQVNNVNPGKNLYATLGLEDGASVAKVQAAYQEKKQEIVASTTVDVTGALEKISYAKQVLTATDTKANYDTVRVEPTVFARIISPTTLYVYIEKMSPATESEFESAIRDTIRADTSSMVLDLRGNLGGDLTTAQTFLGLFLGPNQYAFDFFARNEYQAQRTLGLSVMPELKKIKEIAILTDSMTQSTAEVITAAMKRQRLARSVGSVTRGWGSVEQIIPMKSSIDGGTYTILLVVELTVRDDAQAIEGAGVFPDVDSTRPGWQKLLPQYFYSQDLIAAIQRQMASPPKK